MIEIRHLQIQQGQTIQSAYDDLFRARRLTNRDSFYLWLLELLAPQPHESLLDVACGNGRLVELAAARGLNALGLELSWPGIAHAVAAAPRARWLLANGQEIPLESGSVDTVYSIGSLEHYDDPLLGAAEIARVLKPSGRACILLPNTFGLFGNILHVWRTGEVFDDGQPRQRYATRATWQAMLEAAGLVCERLVGWGEANRPRTPTDTLFYLTRPQKIVRSGLASLAPINLANHLIFICRRAQAPRSAYIPTFPR